MKKTLILSFLMPALLAFSQSENKLASITSKTLRVEVAQSFPQIHSYNWISNNNTLLGQDEKLTEVKINGKLYTPKVSCTVRKNIASYVLDIPEIKVIIKAQIKVENNTVEFGLTQIIENGDFKVGTFEIPKHNLLTVKASQTGAAFAGAKMYTAVKGCGDTFTPLTAETKTDSIPQNYLYGIVNTNQLAGAIWTNAVGEKSDDHRIQKQTIKKDGLNQTGIWSGSWIYRAQGVKTTDALPVAKVVITPDANNDQKVDWQDAAIAFRSIMNNPLGTDRIRDLVVERIPMNFGSQATNPFTKTLDETKRIYLNTDGLGQFVILKGYGSEGHDSKHPDYGDIGKRQGGATQMEYLCKQAQKYNAFMGVHINGTESYPEATAFDDSLVNKTKKGWDWLDPSYYINKRYDGASGNRLARLQSLKNQVPSLNFIYCDVWYAKGSWDSRKLGQEIHSLGLTLGTEFPNDHEFDAVWNHWAVDYNYGGKDIKGFNSQIVRFIRNHQKDTWIGRHPLLGGSEMFDFEGWQGRNSIDSCILMTFKTGLPTKYLQHFTIQKWEENSITLDKNVTVSNAAGKRIISKDGHVVLSGDAYLLPWNPLTEEKLYHWNLTGGTTNWDLPASWKNAKTVQLYKLTDQGRVFVQALEVLNGQVGIQANAATPYVIYKKKAAPQPETRWGENSLVNDPGFNAGNLKNWKTEGNGASVVRNSRGQYELVLSGNEATKVSQTLSGLAAGSYYASVYVSSPENRKATFGVNQGGKETTVYCNSSLWKNYIAADSKSDTTMQRMYVYFKVPAGDTTADLFVSTEKGTGKVTLDDVRIMAMPHTAKADSIFFAEDFENIPDGLYPFVKGISGGTNDPRTHLSELHTPYTQKGWNNKAIDDVITGNWSLKAHGEGTGLLLQTIPQTVRFTAGKTYTVTFNYETFANDYALVIGENTTKQLSVTIQKACDPTKCSFTFVAGKSGNSWFGIEKLNDNDSDLVIDDLVILEK